MGCTAVVAAVGLGLYHTILLPSPHPVSILAVVVAGAFPVYNTCLVPMPRPVCCLVSVARAHTVTYWS